ncbi:MAG: hypothetical protein ABEI58_00765, partial [Candidatus Nanohaloarchaea archaeon]
MNQLKISLLFSLILFVATGVAAQPAKLPHSFYGEVSLDNPGQGNPQAFQSGTVSARVGGEQVAELSYSNGDYGGPGVYDDKLLVQGSSFENGDKITFYVNGLEAGTATFSSGSISKKDLSVKVPSEDKPAEVSKVKEDVNKGETIDVEVPAVAADLEDCTL